MHLVTALTVLHARISMVDLNLSDTLEIGIEAHRKGRLEVSYQNFLAILRVAPNHPDASHNMGLLRVALVNQRKLSLSSQKQ